MIRFSRVILPAVVAANVMFSRPVQFAAAAEAREVRSVLATDLSSAELEEIITEIRERAFFTARGTNATYVQKLFDIAAKYDRGELDLATARLEMKQWLAEIGYQAIPGAEGTITDFASDPRINLQLNMMAQSSAGYGNWKYGQQQPILDQWPAQELFRAAPVKEPRNWILRWSDAGGKFFGPNNNRMIALVNDDIWMRISRFGTPYSPFDFGSQMRTRAIDYDTSLSLGVITKETPRQTPQTRDFNKDLKVTTDIRETALREALEEYGYRFETGPDGNEFLTMGENA